MPIAEHAPGLSWSDLEAWAKQQHDKPSRSQAVRRLIEFALAIKTKRRTNSKLLPQQLRQKDHDDADIQDLVGDFLAIALFTPISVWWLDRPIALFVHDMFGSPQIAGDLGRSPILSISLVSALLLLYRLNFVSEVTRPMVSVRYLCGYRACGNEYPFSQRRHCRQFCRRFDWIVHRCCLACE